MKREGSLIAFSVVAVLVGMTAPAQPPAAALHGAIKAPPASHRVAATPAAAHAPPRPGARANFATATRGSASTSGGRTMSGGRTTLGGQAIFGGRQVPHSLPQTSQHLTTLPAGTPSQAPAARRSALSAASGNAWSGMSDNARRRGAPLNAVLGGPATFDARKLVRR
jgi:hypothetical protein